MKILGSLLCGFFSIASLQAAEMAHVAVGQIVEHPALDMLRTNLKEGLEKEGYIEGKNLKWTYENAQGNPSTAVQVAHKLVSVNPTLIVTLSTPMTQAVASSTTTIPVVFGAVSDPESAKLTGHSNVTGLTDFVPPEQQIELVKAVVPQLKTIGVIFNSGEANSQNQFQAIKAVAEKQDIQVIEATVSKSSDVTTATNALVGQVEAILLPTDNTVISALETILKIGIHNKIPVFGSDVDIVRRGAVAAYGVDWRTSGHELSQMVSALLKGTPIKDVPIQNPKLLQLHINRGAAEKMGVSIPADLTKKADLVL